jgi:murein DD-endopeptidase MepM/ murein hydrolase activator NlpD
MVVLRHENNLASGYCHMSRFASGLHAGQHVEARQLIGYVGATGRVTGPHLHFWVKRGDTFIDPLSLRLDGVRVLPAGDRDDFAALREELDQALDGISLPAAGDSDGGGDADRAGRDGGEGEMFYEEPP